MTQTIMNVRETPIDVGILIGRFQVHELHEAHKDLIDTVLAKHDRVIIFIGLSPLKNTVNNPLDFNTRKRMIQETYPDVEVYYVKDNPSDEAWSKSLDREINQFLKPYQTAVLYGSRDSFIPYYSGMFPVKELESTKYISGTEIRKRIANKYTNSAAFRAGAIAASLDRYPTCYPCVDIAIIDRSRGMVLLGKKEGEAELRFIGGFADPKSPNYETDARREVREETGVEVDGLVYVGSTIINDWRYRKETDKIKTLFFVGTYIHGRPQAADDIAHVEWVELSELIAGKIKIMPEHQVLVEMLSKYTQEQNRIENQSRLDALHGAN
jgi:bifunctional NMN adenylyltransferase/nudix hydrolase